MALFHKYNEVGVIVSVHSDSILLFNKSPICYEKANEPFASFYLKYLCSSVPMRLPAVALDKDEAKVLISSFFFPHSIYYVSMMAVCVCVLFGF